MTKTKIKIAIVIGVVVLLAAIAILAFKKHRQDIYAQQFQGTWEGSMTAGAGRGQYRWRYVVKIFKMNGANHVVVDQIDFGQKNILPTKLEMGKLAIDFGTDSYTYHGVLHKEGTEIRGIWKWGQAQFLLTLEKTMTPDSVPEPLAQEDYAPRQGSDLQGIWKGTVTNKSSSFRLYLKIAEPTNGNFRAELDSIDY